MTTRLAARLPGPLLAILFTAYSLGHSGVGVHDLARFGLYVALGLVLPGTLLWRVLVSDGRRTLLEDVACGTSLAYATELAVYMVCAHFNHPGGARWWPALVILALVIPGVRRAALRPPGQVLPAWMPWLLSALVAFGVSSVTRTIWDLYPIHGTAMRSPYVDIPYHLSLIGALSRHVPVDVPAVAGQPLYYHWFVHADLAAARHATGIEPLVLLTRLGPLAFMVVVILGVAALGHRVTRSPVGGALAAVLLCCAGGASLSRNFGNIFMSGYIFLSPTTIFAMALLIATMAITFELLRPDPSPERSSGPSRVSVGAVARWAVLVLMLAAVSGAKGSLLPLILAGYASVVVLGLIVERRLNRAAAAMLVIGVLLFEIAQRLIYGGSSQGTGIKPFGIGNRVAENLDLAAAGHVSLALAALTTGVYVVSRLTFWTGAAGLFTLETWRDPRAQFAFAGGLAAVGALVVFDNSSFNQVYFLLVAPPLLAVSSAWGYLAVVRRLPADITRRVLPVAVVVGLAVGFLAKDLFGDVRKTQYTTLRLALPPVAAFGVCVLTGLILALAFGRDHRRLTAVLVTATAVAALGPPITIAAATEMAVTPSEQFRETSKPAFPTFGLGGVIAARWVRDHSDPGALVATNEHCRVPHQTPCDHRSTWIAGFTERQILVEGWSYTSRSGSDAEKQNVPVLHVAFWSPQTLSDNDLAFTHPTAARIARLHDHYGVQWLIVDRRFPADVPGLRKFAHERFHLHQYVVFRLR